MSRVTWGMHAVCGALAIALAAFAADGARAEAQHLPVPKIVIYPGEIISAEALQDRAFNANWSARMPVHRNRNDLVGKVAKRTLVAGQPVPINATRVPDAVTQGKTYRIEFREAGLVISGTAVAMNSGAVGDLVSLRNPDSGAVVSGVVGADGTVRVSAR
jgi:flagella basal body P-ring formation protein FlgA